MKMKKKVVIPIVLTAAAVAAILVPKLLGGTPEHPIVDTYAAQRGELVNSVDVTGMVESSNSVGVYAELSYPVDKVEVKLGDVVQEGDVLCTLDASALESNIRQSEAALASAQAKASHRLQLAEKEYAITQEDIAKDYNSQLLSAQNAVTEAEAALLSAENQLGLAQHDYRSARQDLRDLQDGDYYYDDDQSYDSEVTGARRKRTQAEIALESAQLGIENAKLGLEAAKASLRAVEKQVGDAVEKAKDAITASRLDADFSEQQIALQTLRKDLGDAVIMAPISGTVTAVFATEGATAGAGTLLFVIEDTDDLKVITTIKEYDIDSVAAGMPVTIRADGAGGDEYGGELAMVAPTTLKDASGKTVDTNSAEFEAEVKVMDDSALRIGMNARMSIITERKADVLHIPVEAITLDDEENEIVYILWENEDGTLSAKQIAVQTGMETDFYCEITESELQEGDEVIVNPSGIEDGMQVTRLDLGMTPQAVAA